jgi:hypothetical protein
LAEHFLKYPCDEARTRMLGLYQRCPEDSLSWFDNYLLREQSDPALRAVSEKILSGTLREFVLGEEMKRFARIVDAKNTILRETAGAAIRSYSKNGEVVIACAGVLAKTHQEDLVTLAGRTILEADVDSLDRGMAVEAFTKGLGRNDPQLRSWEAAFLGKFKEKPDAEYVLAAAIPAATPAIAELVKDVRSVTSSHSEKPNTELPQLVRQAVALKLNPPQDARQRVEGWLNLMREIVRGGDNAFRAADYVRQELVAATPEDLRRETVGQVRSALKEYRGYAMVVETLRDLGAKLTAEEAEVLAVRGGTAVW